MLGVQIPPILPEVLVNTLQPEFPGTGLGRGTQPFLCYVRGWDCLIFPLD